MNKRPPRRNFRSTKSRDGVSETVLRLPRVQEQTHAETLYLTHLVQDKTPVIVKLVNDDEISGWIEYYDKDFIRLTRDNAPNVFIYKEQIKFIIENRQRRQMNQVSSEGKQAGPGRSLQAASKNEAFARRKRIP